MDLDVKGLRRQLREGEGLVRKEGSRVKGRELELIFQVLMIL